MVQRIIVTGGAGFIGSNFLRHMVSKYPDYLLINVDKLTYSGNINSISDLNGKSNYRFIQADIRDHKKMLEIIQEGDVVVNFAAESHVDNSIEEPEIFFDTNVLGTHSLLDAARISGAKLFVQISTDEVYGSLDLSSRKKFKEDTAFAPNIPYSATKAGGDLLCRAYYSTWKVPVVVTHCSNNFGPYQYPEKLIPFFIVRAMENKKLPLYGDGKHVRDWIYVLDHCEALLLCLIKGRAGEVYNIGSGNEKSNLEIARAILKAFDKDESQIEFVKDRPGHDRRYAIDTSKIKKELGWRAETSFEEAFAETIEWYRRHQDWIDGIRKRTGVFNPHIDLWKAHFGRNRKRLDR